jgi:hypothetical protein
MRNNTPVPIGGNTCFRCGETGHYANHCPKGNAQNTLGQFNNSGQRQTPQQQQPRNNNQTPQNNKGQQNYIREHVNHVVVETAQEAHDVVFGMFQVNSASALVLFDSEASHSFISAQFVAKHGILVHSMWQNRLNYSGSSAQTIAIQATGSQRTSNGTTHWSVGSPPDSTMVTQDRRRFTSHEGESSLITAHKFYITG